MSFDDPSITVFTATRPFTGLVGERQRLAVRSWLGLSPNLTVVLFSQDPSAFSFAATFTSRVLVEPNIDFTFLGTPFFHSMVERSKVSSSEISVLIHPEILLFPDFISTVKFAHNRLDRDWFLYASSQDVPVFSFHLDADGKYWLADNGQKLNEQKEFLHQRLDQDFCGTEMVMAWNNNGTLPLHDEVFPPFLYGKGFHNRWIISQVGSSKYRFIIDATNAISNIYVNDHTNFSNNENPSWEFAGNSHLYHSFPDFHERENSTSYNKLIKCKTQNKKDDLICMINNTSNNYVEGAANCSMKKEMKRYESVSLPLSLEYLLETRADGNKTIVLTAAGYNYKDMLMSWVCRQRNLKITNFLVYAIDDDIYEFCVLQGVPVLKYSNTDMNIGPNNCHFGSKCFKKVSKVKSRIVLDILKKGYNVVLSDVDIYWFKNPLPLLISYGPGVLVAQSDEYKQHGPINLSPQLNSGFYFARSDTQTISAFKKIVKHALRSTRSEQPSFYDTLCGVKGSTRLGNNKCVEPETNLTVHFLDRDLFPNGGYKSMWKDLNVKKNCVKNGCFILHNNWIVGGGKKTKRQIKTKLWDYDINLRMCIKSWQSTNKSMDIPRKVVFI